MFQECNPENLAHGKTLWLELKDSCGNVIPNGDSNVILTEDINKGISDKEQKQIIENQLLLNNQFSSLSINVTKCSLDLVQLNLSENRLSNLPNSLHLLKKLVYLNLDYNQLTSIPDIICELTSLKTLKASHNRIKDVTNNLETLSNLEDLDLSFNELTNLPISCAKLNHLKKLYLMGNRFNEIPNCVTTGMHSLQIFNFSQNGQSKLNTPPNSVNLNAFYAEKNICPSFPTWILSPKFANLEIVSFNETTFHKYDLPEEPSTSCIKKLSMKQCDLSETIVDKIIARLTSLEELIIGNAKPFSSNSFWYMPIESFKEPSYLKLLDVSRTGITAIPKIISNFTNLSRIDLSFNGINWLAEEICSLRNLSSLIIDSNNLAILPENIGELISLKELKASHNNLHKLPDSIVALANLQYFDLYDNEFETMPESIMKLPNLIGVDLEQNYFPTDDLLFNRTIPYESMRDLLREHWHDLKLPSGIKIQTADDERELSSLSSSTTNSSLKETYLCELPDRIEITDERWDTSEDSADEFDPHECREPKQRVYSPFTFYKPFQRVYCPGEYHEKRILTRIIPMLRNGTLVWSTDYEEGQFEDP
ncbi:leucine-rich repeat protein SHOC-2-like [Hylaeus anthracinus]|uniref:leucine-rich repeat protein SHOC-2-like n=1 Tax=Hylaeus anthracinus TaxID=313031 RepID=UPI0023B9DD5C|nr:leucine-rich repeat protein SHOC-2-like [Hylaeus anthracinus]